MIMDSPLILIYYDMSVILTMAYLFQKLLVTSKVSKNVAFLGKKCVSIILRSILNEGFEEINK